MGQAGLAGTSGKGHDFARVELAQRSTTQLTCSGVGKSRLICKELVDSRVLPSIDQRRNYDC